MTPLYSSFNNRNLPRPFNPIKLRWAVNATSPLCVGFLNLIEREDPFAEIPLIDFLLPNDFIHLLKLGEGEPLRHEGKRNRRVIKLSNEPLMGHGDDFRVIKGKRWELLQRAPTNGFGVSRRSQLHPIRRDQGVVSNRNNAFARIAFGRAKRIELLEIYARDTGFLFELAAGSVVETFIDLHKSAR